MTGDSEQQRQSWEFARGFAKLLLPAPPQLRDANLALWKVHLQALATGSSEIPRECYPIIKRIQPIAKLTTPIYFAATAMYPDRMKDVAEDDTVKALLQILGPGLFTAIITLVYLHRRINRIISELEKERTKELWETLSEEMILNMEIGHTVGTMIQGLGGPEGILLGGIRFAALAPILVMDTPFYDTYRGKKKGKIDRSVEQQRLNCDHAQIAAILLTEFGFWDNKVEAAMVFRDEDWGDLKPPGALRTWKAGLDWIDSARKGICPPQHFSSSDRFQLGKDRIEALAEQVEGILDRGSSFSWMTRSSKNGLMIEAPAEGEKKE